MIDEKNEIPEGFKMTELGLLPEEWNVTSLENVFKITSGKSRPKKILSLPNKEYKYPIYGGNGIMGYSKEYFIDCATIVLGRVGAYCGSVYAVSGKNWISDNALYAKKFLKEIDLYYLATALKILNLNRLKNTGGQPLISQSIVYSQDIPLPPFSEQKKIAAVLSAVQEAREKTENVISAAKELKKSLMKHLFTYGPVSLQQAQKVKLKDTEIGPIPEKWKVAQLGQLADFKNGINFKANQKGEKGILTIDVYNMYGPKLSVNLKNLYRVNKKFNKNYLLEENDILFVRSSLKREGVGWTTLYKAIEEPVTFCGFLIRARLNSNTIDAEYLTNYLRSDIARISLVSRSGKVAITNINQGMLGKVKIPKPPIEEQKQIASILYAVDQRIEAEENKKKALEELFKTLLNNLMTAKIRVNHLEIAA